MFLSAFFLQFALQEKKFEKKSSMQFIKDNFLTVSYSHIKLFIFVSVQRREETLDYLNSFIIVFVFLISSLMLVPSPTSPTPFYLSSEPRFPLQSPQSPAEISFIFVRSTISPSTFPLQLFINTPNSLIYISLILFSAALSPIYIFLTPAHRVPT